MTIRRPATGTDPRSTLSLHNVKQMVDATNLTENRTSRIRPIPVNTELNTALTQMCWLKNETGNDIEMHQPVYVDDSMVTPELARDFVDCEEMPLSASSGSEHPNYVVALAPIPIGDVGPAAIGGNICCKIEIRAAWDWCKRVGFDPNVTTERLAVIPNGDAQLLWYDDTVLAGAALAWVRLGPPQYIQVIGKASGAINYGSSGTVRVWEGAVDRGTGADITAYLDWMHSSTNISSGKEVLCQWNPYENKWRVIGAECE